MVVACSVGGGLDRVTKNCRQPFKVSRQRIGGKGFAANDGVLVKYCSIAYLHLICRTRTKVMTSVDV